MSYREGQRSGRAEQPIVPHPLAANLLRTFTADKCPNKKQQRHQVEVQDMSWIAHYFDPKLNANATTRP